MAHPVVTLHWEDNNGAVAETRFRLGDGVGYPEAEAVSTAIAEAAQDCSDAVLVRIELQWRFDIALPPAPAATSDVRRAAILFYRDGNILASFRVPSPIELLAETSGEYAGIRITPDSLDLLGLLPKVQGLVANALDPLGRPYGGDFSVGGITRV